ncbi:tail fiber assembly protein [Salmonella enterica subsp. enterica]|nr:tail fiber assembly protein [Salmonella enterica subsp. enterica]
MKERYFYSQQEWGFFLLSLKEAYAKSSEGWPSDAKEITEELYSSLLAGQEAGQVIITGDNGLPELSKSKPDFIREAELKKSRLMQIATDAIAPLQDAVVLDIATEEETALLLAWKKYRVLINRIKPEDAPDIDWPEVPGDVA